MLFFNSHIDIQRDYFERKGLPLHSSGSILSYHAAPKGTSGGRESSAVATVDHSEVILCAFIYHPIKVYIYYMYVFVWVWRFVILAYWGLSIQL